MTGPASDPERPATVSQCPWCSAEVTGDPARCPSCGAALREETGADIPGVTQLDPAATSSRPASRSRGLLGWLSGEYEGAEAAGERASVEPPSQAVRAEMARLEMEAIQAHLDAVAAEEALAAEDVAAAIAAEEAAAAAAAAAELIPDDSEPSETATEPGKPAT
jgi:hypothetical protein